jgi:hypothetical protein
MDVGKRVVGRLNRSEEWQECARILARGADQPIELPSAPQFAGCCVAPSGDVAVTRHLDAHRPSSILPLLPLRWLVKPAGFSPPGA